MEDVNALKLKLNESNIVMIGVAQRLVLRVVLNHKTIDADLLPESLNQWCETIKEASSLTSVDWGFEKTFRNKDNEKNIIAFYFKNTFGETFKVIVDLSVSLFNLIKDPLFNPQWIL